MLNIVVAPYRDAYFYEKYGPAVRDLQIIDTLASLDIVKKIHVINRPVSVYERVTTKKNFNKLAGNKKIKVYDKTSYNLFGPIISPRVWAGNVHSKYCRDLLGQLVDDQCNNVFIDFMPTGIIPERDNVGPWLLWYDFIDNFTKHNRFTPQEKAAVAEKYVNVRSCYNYITFVSDACSNYYADKPKNSSVLTNKIFISEADKENVVRLDLHENVYDLGFVGFITDKLDVPFLKKLAAQYSIVLYGKFFNDKIRGDLENISNIKIMGEFAYTELPKIMNTFRVGLVPYILQKSHDESPLKIYEYLKNNKPCLSSLDFEFSDNKYVVNYNSNNFDYTRINCLLSKSGSPEIFSSLDKEHFLKSSLIKIVNEILET
ncbi:hypothetical protein QQF40_14880 [Cobetia sp. LC6]|uniref:hypothetical protein n=1 Tax=Cobetia sp. LC6 TaxID=3050947 RepID=UPI002553766A|nr:hypothetical protein [Cobetia sp. LC6]MDL2192666.1 hypothetical protein [Cobetia sp. LC6]